MKKPNVVILARHYPLSGGRTVFMKRLVAALSEQVNFVVIAKPEKEKHTAESTFSLLKYYVRSYQELKRLSKTQRIDLILGTGLSSFGGFVFGKLHHVPTLLNVSAVRSFKRKAQESGLQQSMNASNPRSKFNLFTRGSAIIRIIADMLSLRWCTQAIVPSEASKEYIVERLSYANKIISVNEGVPPEFMQGINKPELEKLNFKGKRVIIFYPIEDSFDSPFFKETLRRLDKQNDLVLIIGKRIIYRVDAAKQILETTFRVKDILFIADVLICTYAGLELHSTTGLEALSAGVIVISPNLGWWRKEFGSDSILLLNALTPDKIVEKLDAIFANRGAFEKETSQLRKRLLATYDFEQCIQQSLQIILNLVKTQNKEHHEDHTQSF